MRMRMGGRGQQMKTVLVLVLALVALVAANQAFVGLNDNKTNLVLQPPAGGQVLVNGQVFEELVQRVLQLEGARGELEEARAELERARSQLEDVRTELQTVRTAHQAFVEVSGAGVDVVNGKYVFDGIFEGRLAFVKVQNNVSKPFVTAEDALVWIAFERTHTMKTTNGNAISGSCHSSCAATCNSCGSSCSITATNGRPIASCSTSSFVKTAVMTTVTGWTIGDSNGNRYFTSTNSGQNGFPPTAAVHWNLGPAGQAPSPSLNVL